MGDLISRRAVLEAILGEPTDAHYPSWYAEKVRELPSAEPQIIRCKYCKRFRPSDNGKFGICKKHNGILNPTDFCSFAERMEGKHE